MRQLFNKSGTIIVFFAATFFLCSFLISLLMNYGSSDIYGQFSQDAEYIVIKQQNTDSKALSYSDIAESLSSYPAKGAVIFDMGRGKTGYILYNYSDEKDFTGTFNLIDVDSDIPQTMIIPVYQPYCMPIDGKQTINLLGVNYEVVGLNIYSGVGGVDYICNIAGLSDSTTNFQGLTLIIDAGKNSNVITNNFINDIKEKNEDVYYSSTKISNESGGIGFDFILVIITILLIGLLLLLNAGVFTSSWISSKKTEIAARRICGASDSDIKRLVFFNYFFICLFGTFIGFLCTFLITSFTGVSYYLGTIDPSAGFISAAFLIAMSGIISYEQAVKYSEEQIAMLRRE